MTEEFQANASLSVEDTTDLFVPQRIGVGILEHEKDAQEALLGVHLVGNYVGIPQDTSYMVVLDTERAVGLLIQLRAMLLQAGVDGSRIIVMMKEAQARLDEVRAMDRAPVEDET